jgi:spore germination protein YaaH/flagellar hook assembly protein FlgD
VTDARAAPPFARRSRLRPLRVLSGALLALALLADPGLTAVRGGEAPGAAGGRGGSATDIPAGPGRSVTHHGRPPAAGGVTRTTGSGGQDSTPSTGDGTEAPAPTEPSIIALDAAAHADDRIAFTPGDRVSTPFRPRPDDGWTVDGLAPRSLPAGAASGRSMAAEAEGSVWAGSPAGPAASSGPDPSGAGPIDAPADTPAVAALPVAAFVPMSQDGAPPAATDLRRQVFGFLPYWELHDASTRLNDDLLSTIAYFGVGADARGNLRKRNADGSTTVGWAGWTSSRMTSVIQAAHHHGTRVVLTVQAFAWTASQAASQAALLDSPAARMTLARQIAAAVRDRGADGVNLDFEPIVSGRADEFVMLVRAIRIELSRAARGYQLTFDTTGSIGNYPIEAATGHGAADAIFIMGYDYRTASAPSAGSIAPLSGAGYDLIDTVQSYLERVPSGRLILGVPYYGRAWSTVSGKPHARTQSGAKYGWSTSVTYANAAAVAKQHSRRYDKAEASAWVAYRRRNCTAAHSCVTTWREVYYDDAQSLRAKYDLIIRSGLRGAGIWALGYDDTRPELYRAIVDKFLHDRTAPDTGIAVLAQRQGDEGFTVTWSAQDLSPIRSYDVQVSIDGGRWRSWISKTKATQAIWLGSDGHGYAFRARATDARGNRGRWNVANLPSANPTLHTGGFASVQTASLTLRSRPDTSGAAIAQLARGDIVALTGGPVRADGYTWYRVTGPLSTWAPTGLVRSGSWVAARTASTTFLVPRTAPNSTIVDAGLAGLSFGSGGPGSLGPSAAARAARAFSPNGDGSEDGLTVRWTNGVALDSLSLRVFRADGTLVGARGVPDVSRGPHAWAWDGTVSGKTVGNGGYVLQLVGQAGSRTFSAPSVRPTTAAQVARYGVLVDTVGPKLTSASISGRLVSPARDGRHDSVSLAATSSGATHWRLTAAPVGPAGTRPAVRTVGGPGGKPKPSWDGRTDAGTPAPDGRYRLTLAVLDDAGNAAARSWDVIVDGTVPAVSPVALPVTFSPDGDGVADAAVVRWTTDETAIATVRIYRGTRLVRTLGSTAAGRSGALRWNGRGRGGSRLADGTYLARITAQDGAGNRRTVGVALRLDRTAGWLRWAPGAFYPQDLDALAKTARASFRLTRGATTSLVVLDGDGAVIRTAWAARTTKAGTVRWTWDGRAASKAMVAPGSYTLELTARSAAGTTVLRRAIVVDAFAIVPSATRLRPGRILTVAIRSSEALSSRPVVTFDQAGRPPVRTFATRAGPGRYVARFRVVAGGTGTATIRVSALDAAGRRNASSRAVSVV